MDEEILSKKTVAVLLVLSLMLSVFGTLAVLNYLEGYQEARQPTRAYQPSVQQQPASAGGLSLEITREPAEISSTGMVSLEIQR